MDREDAILMSAWKTYGRLIKVETRAHYAVIGFFTVLVFSGILLFSLFLHNSSANNKFNYYDIVFNESVNGLSKGSMVQYSGIQVGEVISLNLDKDDPNKVWAHIRVNAAVKIRQDTQALLAIRGITGTAYIQLSKGSPQSAVLKTSEQHPAVIVSVPSALSKIIDHGEGLMTNINHSLTQLNKLLTEENIQRFDNTLRNIEQITVNINTHNDDIKMTLSNIAQASKDVKQLASTANQQSNQTFRKVNQLILGIEKDHQLVSSLIKNNYSSISSGLQSLNRVDPILRDLQNTVRKLNEITRKFNEQPANYLLEREQRKEYLPK